MYEISAPLTKLWRCWELTRFGRFFGYFSFPWTNLRQDPLEAILVICGRRALIFLFERSKKKWKMTPLLCACAVVITLETQKCRKRAPRSVEFNFFNPLKAVVRIYPYLPLCRVWWLWSPLNKLWSSYGHENLATWHSNVEDYSSTNKFGNVFKRFPKLRLEKQIRNGFLNKPCLQRVNNCDRQKRFSQTERRRADLQKVASDFLIFA